MRLERFLNEDTDFTTMDKSQVLEYIHKNCDKWLKEGIPLFRGMAWVSGVVVTKNSRSDRESLSGNETKHKVSDDIFLDLFGWRARTNVVLGTSKIKHAEMFSTVYMILPIGDFKYIYSKDIGDFIDIGLENGTIVTGPFDSHSSFNIETELRDNPEFVPTYKKFLKKHYTDKGLNNQSDVGEVMLKCDKYLCIKVEARHGRLGSKEPNMFTIDELKGLFK